jgi:hypothetical protein
MGNAVLLRSREIEALIANPTWQEPLRREERVMIGIDIHALDKEPVEFSANVAATLSHSR